MGDKHRSPPGDQRRRLTRDQDYDVRRIASPASREKRKPGTGLALADSDGDRDSGHRTGKPRQAGGKGV